MLDPAKFRYETILNELDFNTAEDLRRSLGIKSRAAYVRLCVTAGPAGHDPNLQRALMEIALLSALIRSAIECGTLSNTDCKRELGKLTRLFGQALALQKEERP